MEIPDELADELADKILDFMHHWSPCDNSSDYICELCYTRADTNQGDIKHTDDCRGKIWLHFLSGNGT